MKEHFKWTLHNLVAHPLGEVIHLVGCFPLLPDKVIKLSEKCGNWVHDVTIPKHEKGTGRG